jgi:hypothetical protein
LTRRGATIIEILKRGPRRGKRMQGSPEKPPEQVKGVELPPPEAGLPVLPSVGPRQQPEVGALPVTGADATLFVVAGLVLVAVGQTLRRRARGATKA